MKGCYINNLSRVKLLIFGSTYFLIFNKNHMILLKSYDFNQNHMTLTSNLKTFWKKNFEIKYFDQFLTNFNNEIIVWKLLSLAIKSHKNYQNIITGYWDINVLILYLNSIFILKKNFEMKYLDQFSTNFNNEIIFWKSSSLTIKSHKNFQNIITGYWDINILILYLNSIFIFEKKTLW